MTDKMREEFEAAFREKFGFGRLTASANADAHQMLKAAEWAWEASREALVIELPDKFDPNGGGDWAMWEELVVRSIEAAGLKVKP